MSAGARRVTQEAHKQKAPANGRGCNQGDENESLYE
jgi:hypothetical protein